MYTYVYIYIYIYIPKASEAKAGGTVYANEVSREGASPEDSKSWYTSGVLPAQICVFLDLHKSLTKSRKSSDVSAIIVVFV
jgi:hypothetical protein